MTDVVEKEEEEEVIVEEVKEEVAEEAGEEEVTVEENVTVPSSMLQQFIEQQAALTEQLHQAQAEQRRLQEEHDSDSVQRAAAEAASLEQQALTTKVQDLEEQYSNALISGDKEAATKVHKELTAAREEITTATVTTLLAQREASLTTAMDKRLAKERFDHAVEQTIGQYPELDSTSAKFDSVLTAQVNELTQLYSSSGTPLDVALAKAVKLSISTPPTEVAPLSKRKSITDKLGDASRQPGSQPGKTSSPSVVSDVVNIDTLSDRDFAALSKEAIKAMRGDSV